MIRNTLLLLFLTMSVSLFAQQPYVELAEIVTDSAKIFNSNELQSLKEKLIAFERETTNQLVTLQRLGFETIETYANGLFN
ncbi:MAG: hypothetical protein ACJART_000071 [Maribacter sp.]|jgi:uncharacterized protein